MNKSNFTFLFFLLLGIFSNLQGQAIQLAIDATLGSGSTYNTDSDDDNGIIGSVGTKVYTYAKSQGMYRVWSFDSKTLTQTQLFEKDVDQLDDFIFDGNKLYFVVDQNQIFLIDDENPAQQIHSTTDYIGSIVLFNGSICWLEDDFLYAMSNTLQKQKIFTFGLFGGRSLGVLKDKLIILGRDANNISKLFLSDGKVNGTIPFYTFGSGNEFSRDHHMTAVGDKMFFWYNPESEPYDLYVTDGTDAGTKLLKSFKNIPFTDLKKDRSILGYKNKLYFRGSTLADGDHLYVSDGTVAGTKLFYNPNSAFDDPSRPKYMIIYNDRLYFSTINSWYNPGLYSTDGVNKKFESTSFNYAGSFLTMFKDSLYFIGGKTTWEAELYSSKTNINNSKQLSYESVGNVEFYPNDLTASSDFLFFTARKPDTGRELYYYNPKYSTAVDEVESKGDLIVIQNPVDEYLKYKFTNYDESIKHNYAVKDISGKVLLSGNNTDGILNVSTLIPGVYYLSVSNKSKITMRKFVKL